MRESPEETNFATDNGQTLTISAEKVCFVVVKAREFGAKGEVTDPVGHSCEDLEVGPERSYEERGSGANGGAFMRYDNDSSSRITRGGHHAWYQARR